METSKEIQGLFYDFFVNTSEIVNNEKLLNFSKEDLEKLRQYGEWILSSMHRFFETTNELIGDGAISPLDVGYKIGMILEAKKEVVNNASNE